MSDTMTPKQRAQAIATRWRNSLMYDNGNALAGDIAAAIRAAVEAETERCAKVGEDIKADWQIYSGPRHAVQAVIDGIRSTATKDSNTEGER